MDLRAINEYLVATAPFLKRKLDFCPSGKMIEIDKVFWQNKLARGVRPLIGAAPEKNNLSIHRG